MNIPTVTEIAPLAPAPPVPPGAPTGPVEAAAQQGTVATAVAPVTTAADDAATPPPAPVVGFQQDVLVGIDEATNRKVYDIVEPDTGDQIVQIPAEAVLNLVAKILQQLEAEGLR